MTPREKDCYLVSELAPGVYDIGDLPKDYPSDKAVVDAYLVVGEKKALLIDTGASGGDFKSRVDALTDLPVEVLLLHGHGDHTGGADQFDTVYMDPRDIEMAKAMSGLFSGSRFDPEKTLPAFPGQVFDLGGRRIEVLSMAGHTPGSLVALDRERQQLFSSDSVGSGAIWLHIPYTLPLSVFLKELIALQDQVKDLTNLALFTGHRNQNLGPMGQNYLNDLRSLTEDILAGRVTGQPLEEDAPWPGLWARQGLMGSFCYHPDNLYEIPGPGDGR